MKRYIIIEEVKEQPNIEKYWRYHITELSYIMEQIQDGDRVNGYTFLLYNNFLYETEETETVL